MSHETSSPHPNSIQLWSRGPRTFALLCLASGISFAGSQVTTFALGIWLFGTTHSVTTYALFGLAGTLPILLASPFVGVLVDRHDRRRVLAAGYLGGAICSLAIAGIFLADALSASNVIWLVAVASLMNAAQLPCLMSVTTVLVPREKLARANGSLQLAMGIGQIVAPSAAGALLSIWSLNRLILIDVASFIFALAVLAFAKIPSPLPSPEGASRRSLGRELAFGWACVAKYPGLKTLLVFFALVNFVMSIVQVLLTPLVLGFADGRALGTVLSTAGLGILAGSATLALVRGPRHSIHGVLGFTILQSLALFLGAARPSVTVVGMGAFGVAFALPIISGHGHAIWQRLVPPDQQGRVFSVRILVTQSATPLAYLVAGPLADIVFEPAMRPGGALASTLGLILGTGPGRGISLAFVTLGVLLLSAVVVTAMSPSLRSLREPEP